MKKSTLFFNKKIEVRKSPLHGWGIFAKEFISSGEILEENPFLIIPLQTGEASSIFIDYRFNYPRIEARNQVIPFGFSCLYNHSDTPNAKWETDEENSLFIFSAVRDIEKDEEICVYYGGDNYWSDGRKNVNIIK